MAKNKIGDLRDHLFATLESLRDTENPMELDRARAISTVAQTIINSAKVEADLVKAVGLSSGSKFFDLPQESEESRMPQPRRLASVAKNGAAG